MPNTASVEERIICGRLNCSKCTRWRPVSDFRPKNRRRSDGVRVEILLGTCDSCRNKTERKSYSKLSDEEKRARWTRSNQVRQKRLGRANQGDAARKELLGTLNGRLVSIVPFRMWLIKKLRQCDDNIEELHRRTGLGSKQLQVYIKGYEWNESLACDPRPILTIPITTVDKALMNEGGDSLRSIGYD